MYILRTVGMLRWNYFVLLRDSGIRGVMRYLKEGRSETRVDGTLV